MQELISVIVPVYNAEKYLSRCIESILTQTHSQLEVILIDDGSKDRSVQIMEHYSQIDNRIMIFRQENKGVSEARNKGISFAKGKYIGFVDADDTIESTMYEILLDAIHQTDADVAITNWYFIENENRKIPAGWCQTEKYLSMTTEELFGKVFYEGKRWILGTAINKLVKTELVKKVCFEPVLLYGEDIWYSYQILSLSTKVVSVSALLYNYYIHQGSASHGGIIGEKRIDCVEVHKKIAMDLRNKGYSSLSHQAYAYYLDFVLHEINAKKEDSVYQSMLRKLFKQQVVEILKCKAISMKLKISYLLHIIKL